GAKRGNIPTIALSATLANNPLEMRAVGYLLGLHGWTNFWKWSQMHGCRPGRFGGFEFVGGAHHLEDLHKEIFPERGNRTRVRDLGDLFPETQIHAEAYDLQGAAKQLDAIQAEMEAELAALTEQARKDKRNTSGAQLTAMLRA